MREYSSLLNLRLLALEELDWRRRETRFRGTQGGWHGFPDDIERQNQLRRPSSEQRLWKNGDTASQVRRVTGAPRA